MKAARALIRLLALACTLVLPACHPTGGAQSAPTSHGTATAPTIVGSPVADRPGLAQISVGLDAHDGGIVQFDTVYYLYGTSYDCGFQFGVAGTRFCGFNMYSSTDLQGWEYRGQVFDPDSNGWQSVCTPGGCFRPHVVFDPNTGQYVMWINVFSGAYRVLTAPTPTGPWVLEPGAGAVPTPSGDENLFVDDDGVGYLIRTDLRGKKVTDRSHELVIDRLDASYLHVTGPSSRPAVGFVEAPTMWKANGTYYLDYSDPACPYCVATGTSVMTAPTPLGPWSEPYSISAKSCGGQPTQVSQLTVAGRAVTLYQSDRWVRLGNDAITRNQARATQAWAPLSYRADGRVNPITCPAPPAMVDPSPTGPQNDRAIESVSN